MDSSKPKFKWAFEFTICRNDKGRNVNKQKFLRLKYVFYGTYASNFCNFETFLTWKPHNQCDHNAHSLSLLLTGFWEESYSNYILQQLTYQEARHCQEGFIFNKYMTHTCFYRSCNAILKTSRNKLKASLLFRQLILFTKCFCPQLLLIQVAFFTL